MLENTGNFFEYYSCANGKGRQIVKATLEKDNFAIRENTVQEGIKKVLKILIKSYEGEKETEYDIGVISAASNNLHQVIDNNFVSSEATKLKEEIKQEKMDVDK